MKKVKYFFLAITTIWISKTNAQYFQPLKASNKSEWLKDAELLTNTNLLLLHNHNTHYYYYDIEDDLAKNDQSLSTISLYNDQMQLLKEKKIYSTQDSIYVYNEIEEDEKNEEIIALGILITPEATFLSALWLDYNLNTLSKFIYTDDTIPNYIKFPFFVNSSNNIMTYNKEFDRNGQMISTYRDILITFEDQKNEQFIGFYPNEQFTSFYTPKSNTTTHRKTISIDYDTQDLVESSDQIAISANKTYLYGSTLTADCGKGTGQKSFIVKFNTENYTSEKFYVDPTENCLDYRNGVLGIDLYDDNYIYFINEVEGCNLLPLPDIERLCEVNYLSINCLDQQGNLRWSKYLGGDALYQDCNVVATADTGCLVLVTRFEQGVNNVIETEPVFLKETDTYYLKFDNKGNVVDTLTSNFSENELEDAIIQVYPNPANEWVTFKIPVTIPNELYIEVYNLKGQLKLSQKLSSEAIDISGLPTGHYTYKISSSSIEIKTGKLIKL